MVVMAVAMAVMTWSSANMGLAYTVAMAEGRKGRISRKDVKEGRKEGREERKGGSKGRKKGKKGKEGRKEGREGGREIGPSVGSR